MLNAIKVFFGGDTRNLDNAMEGVKKRVGSLNSLLGKIGIGLGVGALVASFQKMRAELDMIGKTADRVGVSTDTFQVLQFAASQTGASVEQLNTSLTALARRAGNALGGGSYAKVFEDAGISVRKFDGSLKSTEELLGDVADALKNTTSQSERLQIADSLLSETGRKLVLTLQDGREGLDAFAESARKAGLIIDEETIRKTEALNDRIDVLQRRLKADFGGGFMEFIFFAGRGLKSLADALGTFAGKIVYANDTITDKFKNLLRVIMPIPALIMEIKNAWGDNKAEEDAAIAQQKIQREAQKTLEKQAEQLKAKEEQQRKAAEAEKKLNEDIAKEVQEAIKKEQDLRLKLAEIRRRSARAGMSDEDKRKALIGDLVKLKEAEAQAESWGDEKRRLEILIKIQEKADEINELEKKIASDKEKAQEKEKAKQAQINDQLRDANNLRLDGIKDYQEALRDMQTGEQDRSARSLQDIAERADPSITERDAVKARRIQRYEQRARELQDRGKFGAAEEMRSRGDNLRRQLTNLQSSERDPSAPFKKALEGTETNVREINEKLSTLEGQLK